MSTQTTQVAPDWRQELPSLAARQVLLREPLPHDAGALFELLSVPDATRFGIDGPLTEAATRELVERVARERKSGAAFTYAITPGAPRGLVGLIQVRQLEPSFESAEWECTLAPASRGTGVFLEAVRLVGSFAFDAIGVRRLETRVLLQNGRANTALRKLGAVEEGILRRSVRRDGQYFDQTLWSLLKEDWGANRLSIAPRVH